jgi:hypothetical protein
VQSAEISVAASLTKVLCRFSTEFSTVDVENYSYRIPDPIAVQQQPILDTGGSSCSFGFFICEAPKN